MKYSFAPPRTCFHTVLALLLLFAVGCQGTPTVSPETPDSATGQESSCRPLVVVGDSAEAVRPFELEAEELCRRFGVQPVLRYPSYLTSDLLDFVAGSTDPVDLVILPPRHLDEYVERQLIRNVDPWVQPGEPWLTDILPVYRNLYMRFNDQYYGFVYDGDSHLLYYRKDLFDQLGIAVPETWSQYDEAAGILAARKGFSGAQTYGTAVIETEHKAYMAFAERFGSAGGEYFDEQMHPLIADTLAVRVLTELVQVRHSAAPEALFDWADLNRALMAGSIPLAIQFSDTARFSYDSAVWKSQVAGRLGWALVPGGEEGAPRGGVWYGRILAIGAKSRQPDTAAEVARYITGPEVSGRMIARSDTINDPYRYSHFEPGRPAPLFPDQATADDFFRTLLKSLERPMADLTIPGGWSYTQALDRAVQRALRNEQTPAAALKQAAAEWEQITEEHGREPQARAFAAWRQAVTGDRP